MSNEITVDETAVGGSPGRREPGEAARPATAASTASPVVPSPAEHLVDLPEPLGYRIKQRVLGRPLRTEQLAHERLGKPTALAVFASDNLSSSAYATEEILRVLVPAVGIAAFSLVVPITVAMLVVLGFLILSYRQTIKAYPSAGGAYIVTRDNFGVFWAQVAGVALLTDYVLTVAVSTAAGAAALASAFSGVTPFVLPVAVVFVLIIAGGNLKGVRESGKAFAVPTYFFVANMVVLLAVGLYRAVTGALVTDSLDVEGAVTVGSGGDGILMGATLFVVLHAFASGGAAVTGVEAISNGVPAFKEPSWKNARSTLVVMGSLLGTMFLGLSFLATKVHPVPYEEGTPTVISQIAESVYGHGAGGQVLFYSLQAGTMLILVLAANTSFADFPRLASFQAGDNFLPRQLTKRGHRLVFSNGILALSAAAVVLLVVTGAKVDRLIPLYAVGVFTSFTLSQAGMARHHLRLREPAWRTGLLINSIGAVLSFVVLIVVASTKFVEGAWVIVVFVPLAVIPLFRLNRQYSEEREQLAEGAAAHAAEAPILDRHVVIVMLGSLDMAAARAIQYARTLVPDELIAVHFDLDPQRTDELRSAWSRLGLSRIPLDIVECADRRLERAAAEVCARHLVAGDTEVSVLIPRREYSRVWHRFVHDQTADKLSSTLSALPHCNVTIVPFQLASSSAPKLRRPFGSSRDESRRSRSGQDEISEVRALLPEDRTPIGELRHRQRAHTAGRVYSMRVQPWGGTPSLELKLADDTGAIDLIFFGRRELAGVGPGTLLAVDGVVSEHRGSLALLNPAYEILLDAEAHP